MEKIKNIQVIFLRVVPLLPFKRGWGHLLALPCPFHCAIAVWADIRRASLNVWSATKGSFCLCSFEAIWPLGKGTDVRVWNCTCMCVFLAIKHELRMCWRKSVLNQVLFNTDKESTVVRLAGMEPLPLMSTLCQASGWSLENHRGRNEGENVHRDDLTGIVS